MGVQMESLRNRILASLAPSSFERLQRNLSLNSLNARDILLHEDECIQHVYFPVTAVISSICVSEDGKSLDVGLVGYEGLVGLTGILGEHRSDVNLQVQVEGLCYRGSVIPLRRDFDRLLDFRKAVLDYADALMAQIKRTAVCNRFHLLEKRFCRWLLMVQDRSTSKLRVTHESMAESLGASRPQVTMVARALQKRSLIRCARGQIEIMDRPGLEKNACECYGSVRSLCGFPEKGGDGDMDRRGSSL